MEQQTPHFHPSQKARSGSALDRIGERVVEIRNARGWKQTELARRAGCRPARLSMIERGARRPTLEELVERMLQMLLLGYRFARRGTPEEGRESC